MCLQDLCCCFNGFALVFNVFFCVFECFWSGFFGWSVVTGVLLEPNSPPKDDPGDGTAAEAPLRRHGDERQSHQGAASIHFPTKKRMALVRCAVFWVVFLGSFWGGFEA